MQRLREVEAAGDAAGSSAEPSQAGLPQKDLLSWYFDKMVERYKSLCFLNTLVCPASGLYTECDLMHTMNMTAGIGMRLACLNWPHPACKAGHSLADS